MRPEPWRTYERHRAWVRLARMLGQGAPVLILYLLVVLLVVQIYHLHFL
jgi:hypothetical protein